MVPARKLDFNYQVPQGSDIKTVKDIIDTMNAFQKVGIKMSPIQQVAPYQPDGRRPQGLICHAMWILACIILFIIYFEAEIAVVNEDKILK
jgi:hypothetical protein